MTRSSVAGFPERSLFWLAVLAVLPLLAACGSDKPPPLPGERIPVMQLEPSLQPALELAGQPVALPAPRVNADWPQVNGTANHSFGHLELSDAPREVWRVDIGRGSSRDRKLLGQPIAADGMVFAMDSIGEVSAHRIEDGSLVWESDVAPEEETDGPLGAGLAYENGRIFAASGFAQVIALDAKTGEEIWRRKVSGPMRGSPTVANGRVFVTCIDNTTYALDANDGRVLWNHTGTSEVAGLFGGATPAVADDVVVVAYSSGELFGLRAANGRQIWADFLSLPRRTSAVYDLNDIRASPVIDRGRVYAVGNAGRMVSIVLNSGVRAWDQRISGVQTPWIAGDYIYLVTTDNLLVSLMARDGRVRWVRQLPRYEDEEDLEDPITWTGPVLAGDRLIVAGSNEAAFSVSPYTGEILGQVGLPGSVVIAPMVVARTLIFLTDDGELVAYR